MPGPQQEAIITVGFDHLVRTWSAGAEAVYGWTAAEAIGRPLYELVSPEVTFEAFSHLLDEVLTAGSMTARVSRTRKDGARLTVDLTLVLLRDGDGAPREVLGLSRDVTQLDAEHRAALREARLLGLSDRINEAEIVLSPDGQLVDANDRALETYGYTREELCKLHIFDLRADPPAVVSEQLRQALRRGVRFVAQHRRKDGSTFPVEVSSRGFEVDGTPYLHSLVRDLTAEHAARDEHRRLLERLDASERHYRALFENIDEELTVFDVVRDPDGGFDWVVRAANAMGRKWFRGQYEHAVGTRMRKLLAESSMRQHLEHTEALLKGEHLVIETQAKNGRWYRSASFALDEHTVVASALDITALYETRAELEQAKDRAQHANELKGQFLANMSHEIRTPLNAVLGLARLGLDEPDAARLREYLELIHRSGAGLLGLINDILDFSKIEAGRLTVEHAPFRLTRLLRDVHESLEPVADARGLALRFEVSVPEVVRGDALRVRQVVTNLLSNALKFTEQGHVDLVATLTADGAVQLTVRDTGVGLNAEAEARLFESFMQADASTTRRFGGTGLGLAISRHLARLMGGDLRFVRSTGPGATFVFDTALRAATEAEVDALTALEHSAQAPRVPDSLAGRRVLLVEDNKVNQLLASTLLRKAAMEVTVAEHGRAAVELLTAPGAWFDVVLMDVQMPVMDGLEATRQARTRLGAACPPIVAMTANAMPADKLRTADAGMREHLTKPIDVARLFEVLDALLAD